MKKGYVIDYTTKTVTVTKKFMEEAGINTKAKAICFSLPVTDTAGLRLVED